MTMTQETLLSGLAKLPILLISFGFKAVGKNLPKADIYLDCRSIPNPHHAPEVSKLSGDDPLLIKWIRENGQGVHEVFFDQLMIAIRQIPSRRRELSVEEMFSAPFIVACGCAYGVHRSVAIKHLLAKMLEDEGYNAHIDEIKEEKG